MRHVWTSLAGFAVFAAAPAAQLTDLQPGPNFEPGGNPFGTEPAYSIDAADVDNDGDLDVLVGTYGGSLNPQPSRIFINLGGAQFGTQGTFGDQTETRFSPVPYTHCRDIEFGDIDADGDLDMLMAHSSPGGGVGEPGRFYVNRGGLQGGPVGSFLEETDTRWGRLLSVPPGDEIGLQDGQGPWRENSCDCDFGDLDDDGDLDLFYASYGPNLSGTRASRVFLNDGAGVFHEQWPWADPYADVHLKSPDVNLADLDGDGDLDIFASSINQQSRVYLNNLYGPVGATPFTDITRTALLGTGAQQTQQASYDSELGDLDGDGDFDVWAVAYASGPFDEYLDRVLRNVGPVTGSPVAFVAESDWVQGPTSQVHNEVEFCDFDGDGDLDAFEATYGGGGALYQSGVLQGLVGGGQGVFHGTGSSQGSLAPWPELFPSVHACMWDVECADLDGDGDPDLLWAQECTLGNNGWYRNVLGVPDTHAPKIVSVTDQCDKPEGTATIIHAAVRDNASMALVSDYDTKLIWTDGHGPERVTDMVGQGGMQFRGRIPPAQGSITYRVRCTDGAGNVTESATFGYAQTGPIWTDLGGGSAGAAGTPVFTGAGTWEAHGALELRLEQAAPLAQAGLFVGVGLDPQPFAGGLFLPADPRRPLLATTSASGALELTFRVPTGVACGTGVVLQWIVVDAAGVGGHALSNGLRAVTP